MVSQEVLEEERRIIEMEGWFTVANRYYANAFDADKARRIEAERRVADVAKKCAWCSEYLVEGKWVEAAGERIHADPCLKEFDEFTRTSPAAPAPPPPPVPLEQQLRKSLELGRITNDTVVLWGEWVDQDTPNERYAYEEVKWGELSVYERHTVERV
jgi:hypothetical protein